MKKLIVAFLFANLLSVLAVPIPASASPMTAALNGAQVILTFSPDPPQIGAAHAVLSVTGISTAALARTRVSYSSAMPQMGMSGPTGEASPVPGRPGEWAFDFRVAMATAWVISVRFDGPPNGVATFSFASAGSSANGTTVVGGMSAMGGGHEDVWRNAAIALAVLLGLVAFAAWLYARTIKHGGDRPRWASPGLAALGFIALIAVIGFAVVQARYAPPAMDMSSMVTAQGTAAVPVTEAAARSSGADANIQAPAVIQPYYTEDIAARAPGLVRELNVYNGDRVSAGQTLGVLDEPELSAQAQAAMAGAQSDQAAAAAAMIEAHHHAPNHVVIAEADLRAKREQARYWQYELQREKMLLDNGAVSIEEYQNEQAQAQAAFSDEAAAEKMVMDAHADVEMSQAQLRSAQQRASASAASAFAQQVMAGYTSVIAPDDGVVVKRLVDPGTTVQMGTPLLRIAVVGKVRVQASLADSDVAGVEVGTPLEARLPDGSILRTRVTSVQPVGDASTHTSLVEAVVDNPQGRLKPGAYASVTFFSNRQRVRGAVAVPSAAVVGGGDNAAVWTDVNGAAHRVPVRVAVDDGETAQVIGDIKSGQRVIVQGAQDMAEGTPVTETRS